MANTIIHIQVLSRAGEDDILLSWQHRTSQVDALYQWNGTGWTLLQALQGTSLIYDSCTLQGRVYWADGKNPIQVWKPDSDEICEVTDAPVVQYLVTYQGRIVGGGDARTEAEVIADSQIWPADSNRDRVVYCEPLDDTLWSPNNFIDANIGTGEVISGLGINSITSATRGAQTQLVVFKPTAILVNDGTLNAAEQRLAVVSIALGCPGYHSIVNTPFGLMFASKNTICLMDTSGKEPNQVGFFISPEMALVQSAMQKWHAAVFHENTYKMSISNDSATVNNEEWWLDLKPQIFPQEQNWYGPHTGDQILQYAIFNGVLVGAQMETDDMWRLDVEGSYGSMTAPSTPRTQVMTWPRFQVDNIKRGFVDAYGFRGITDVAGALTFTETISLNQGASTTTVSFVTPVDDSIYNVTRPFRKMKYDGQVSISHSSANDLEIQSVYLRAKQSRRQSEHLEGGSQTRS